jgi:Sec-independent protein translocase protein TatA
MSWGWLLPMFIIFMVFGMPALTRLADGRRKFLLELKREERLIAEAKAKELELEHKRRELEYREAMLELEKFDRRSGMGPGRLGALDPNDPKPEDHERDDPSG